MQVAQLVECGRKTECELIHSVRGMISNRTAVMMKEKEGIAIQVGFSCFVASFLSVFFMQTGVAEMMVRICKFDKLKEEKEIVASMGPLGDPWLANDLDRVDLVFLGDMQALLRLFQDQLVQQYNL